MTWKEVEWMFNRALKSTFSRKKLLFSAPILIFCGLIIVCFRTLASKAGDWIGFSMTFLPIFFCLAILLAMGLVLIRIYHHEVKELPVSYKRTFSHSKELMIEITYLSIPIILSYLILWTVLGIFYLLKEIPMIGEILGIILSFGPFLLLMGSFVLSLLSVFLLFFVTPAMALSTPAIPTGEWGLQFAMLQGVLKRLKANPFSNIVLMLLGLFPLGVVTTLMTIAAIVTGKSYVAAESSLGIGMQWFFIMLPFSTLLAPAIIFFFSFAAEAHVLMLKKTSSCELPS